VLFDPHTFSHPTAALIAFRTSAATPETFVPAWRAGNAITEPGLFHRGAGKLSTGAGKTITEAFF
jgi:hypothetical protein